MNESDPPESAEAAAPTTDGASQALHRDVAALVATVDQHSAELDAIKVEQMILVFALGALAGVVFLQHREMRKVVGAFAD